MKFEFKAVRKKIDLGEYAEEMAGGVIRVRVNVDRATIGRMRAVSAETPLEEFFELLSGLWSEDGRSPDQPDPDRPDHDQPDPDRPTPGPSLKGGEEVWPISDVRGIRALYQHCMEYDPQLWNWVTGRTVGLVIDYQAGQKK